ncbi:MAG: hypothetical protein JXB48_22010, partial [Candidatus Latescibacteria bacterium]|nr:hypothetical protein [Candidatus Latescibacterota bacterium]
MIRLVKNKCTLLLILLIISCSSQFIKKQDENYFLGKYFAGEGDIEYLELLDIARRMFGPDPEFQNLPMFYEPKWNGFIEGPTWDAWWIQNSYGPTYCSLPFLTEPYITFLQNSQDLWFDQIGDGKTEYTYHNHTWIPPDGCLVDAAKPDWAAHKQGDGRVELHDWALEFTAAGALLQAELLLISRDIEKIEKYLPKLERGVNFIETRRDPAMNLFLAGPAGNLLAPSYAGWKKSDGIFDKAYLSGLSITYIAVLDRIIELEKMIQNEEKVMVYENRRHMAQKGLPLLIAEDGCFIKSLDPDGTKHGVFGAEKHGYFDTVCNHDAICFRVVDDTHARIIYDRIVAIPELRQNNTIITNYPSLDDMYVNNKGLFNYGTWVNGGNWSTCEARMIMSYYRLNVFEDARKSMQQLLTFAEKFRMDNPFTNFGSGLNQPNKHINLVYDSFGPPAAFVRGLFEYIYKADELILYPHIPSGISYVEQRFPVRFGEKKLFLSTVGTGKITKVIINGKKWKFFDETSVFLP